MREDSIVKRLKNMPQIKDISFDCTHIPFRKLIPHFGYNIRSFSSSEADVLRVETWMLLKTIQI